MVRTTLRMYGGVEGEIGGNQILLSSEGGEILLDFGYNFSKWRRYFSFPLSRPRSVEEYFQVDLIPADLRNPKTGLVRDTITDVFITHPHGDHWRSLFALPPTEEGGPTVHVGEASKRILDVRAEKLRGFEKVSHLEYRTFRTGRPRKIRVGDFEVTPFHVDHSAPGSYAMIVSTPDGVVVYTGDFRLHGSYSDRVRRRFWDEVYDLYGGVDVLICEGTNIGGCVPPHSEADVEAISMKLIQECRGLVIVNTSPADADRLRTFHRVSSEAGRRLVATKYFMETLEALEACGGLDIPRPSRGEVVGLEEEFEEVSKRPSDYILLTAFYKWREIADLRPPPGSIFILSSSEPFEEEAEIEFERLMNWLRFFGVQVFNVHSSGHVMPQDLRQVIETVSPRVLIPVHTAHPDAFMRYVADILSKRDIEFIKPVRGRPYEVGGR